MVRLSHYRHLDFQENRATFNDRIENRLAVATRPSAPQSSRTEDITDRYIAHDEEEPAVVAYLSPGLVSRLEGYSPLPIVPTSHNTNSQQW